MHIHHFYPRTRNIGDHFVQHGIATLVRDIVPNASFEHFDVNSRGENKTEYGLTRFAIERANREADLVIVGGSNLYEGALGWHWGVSLDTDALKHLQTPLFLLGIGTGSGFNSPLHKASTRATREIRLLNEAASWSWVRDVVTERWLRELGVTKAEMLGDPVTYIFQRPWQRPNGGDPVLIVVPPYRLWHSKRAFWKARRFGRPIFEAFVKAANRLAEAGKEVVVVCNDPRELELAARLFASLPRRVICISELPEYFQLISGSQAVISGRLHTAAVAFSLGKPFLLLDLDQRTRGFIETYQLGHAAITPQSEFASTCSKMNSDLLCDSNRQAWEESIKLRDELCSQGREKLKTALRSIRPTNIV